MNFDINKLEKNINKKAKKISNEAIKKIDKINIETQLERENRLLKESIALSHEELKRFQKVQQKQIETIRNTIVKLDNKINMLKDSNKILNDSIEHEISNISNQIDILLVSKVKMLNKTNTEHVNKLKDLISKSQSRFETFYNKKKWIDRLIFANLAITPILFLIILYFIFCK